MNKILRKIVRSRLSDEQSETISHSLSRMRAPVRWGNLRNVKPINNHWGIERGLPIDRYYINQFMQANRALIKGCAFEIAEPWYIGLFGEGKVTHSDILHVSSLKPPATMIGNLETGEGILQNAYDCSIITQTIQYIFDVGSAVEHIKASLKPGGVALVTAPGICKREALAPESYGEYWHYTEDSLQRLFGEVFGKNQVTVESCGNVLTAVAFLEGVAAEELSREELDARDPLYAVVHMVKAVR